MHASGQGKNDSVDGRSQVAAGGQADRGAGAFRHAALLFRDESEYLAAVSSFVRTALAREEPVLLAVPGYHAGPLREVLGADAEPVIFADMDEVGRNPGRMLSAIRDFSDSHAGRRVSAVGEPAWPGRSAGEYLEAARHEALSNLALAGVPMVALCPYDAARLPRQVLAAAQQTHPLLARGPGETVPSPRFLGYGGIPPECLHPLPDPPPDARAVAYDSDLRPVRELVSRQAALAGLPPERAADLVLAVSELTANTLAHTPGGGVVRVWQTDGEIVCQVSDQGHIADPLAGRLRPASYRGGYGLWVVHQVCDLVEIRTGPAGTTIRCHLSRHR